MKQIIKAELYQLKRELLLYVILVGLLVLFFLTCTVANTSGSADTMMSGDEFIANWYVNLLQMPILWLAVVVGVVCAEDFTDKTSYYEIMSGHSRRDVYFGRVALAILLGILGTILVIGIELGVIYGWFGWEGRMNLQEVVLRDLLLIFPYFRILCELICVSFIIRGRKGTIGIGVGFFLLAQIIQIGRAHV